MELFRDMGNQTGAGAAARRSRLRFVSLLVRRMRRAGVLRALLASVHAATEFEDGFLWLLDKAAFASGTNPLCASGLAAGGAGGGGPGAEGGPSRRFLTEALNF